MHIMLRCFQIVLLVIALAGLFVSSWAECFSGSNIGWGNCLETCPSNCITPSIRSWCESNISSLCDYPDCNPNQLLGCSQNLILSSPYPYGSYYCVLTSVSPSSSMSGFNILGGCGASNPIQICCGTEAERDSVSCVNSGSNWINGQCKNCDSSDPSSWHCETTSSIVKVQESTTDIVCDASFGGCFSGNACAIYTEYQTSCVNECTGGSTVESYRTDPVWQDGFCDEVDIDRDDCGKTRCIDMDGNYALVHDCSSNNIVNGVPQSFPVVIQGGRGSCAANGYQPSNPDSLNNNGNSSNRDSILKAKQDSLYSQDCLLFGKCGDANDSTDFSDDSNRSPDNGCYCERLDDMPFVSRIVCPDGTSSIFYGSCKDWENKPSSSSSTPPSSESGGGGSSEADTRPTDWANWSQANEMNQKLDANNGLLASISEKLSNIFNWFTSSGISVSRDTSTGLGSIDWDSPVFVDSSYTYDTTTYSVFNDVADSLFSLAQQNKGLIDTTSISDVDNCFTCRFNFTRALGGQSVEINFGSLGGFNICRLLRSLLIILTEIACLLMLFSSFIKGGKS